MENRLKQVRKSKKLTLEELGKLVGTTKLHIWRLEKGDRQLTQRWLSKLSKALDCSIADILPQEDADIIKIKNDEFANLTEDEKNLIRTFRKIKEDEQVQKTKIG